jgi:hypothetical protein
VVADLVQPDDRRAENQKEHRHVDGRDGEAAQPGDALGAPPEPPHRRRGHEVRTEDRERGPDPARDARLEREHHHEEDADGLDTKEVDLSRPPESLLGERLPIRERGRIGGARRWLRRYRCIDQAFQCVRSRAGSRFAGSKDQTTGPVRSRRLRTERVVVRT